MMLFREMGLLGFWKIFTWMDRMDRIRNLGCNLCFGCSLGFDFQEI